MTAVPRRLPAAPLAVLAALAAAELTVLLLYPRSGLIAPAQVDARSIFTAAQIARGRSFSDGQWWLFGGELALQAAALALLVTVSRRAHGGPWRRPLLWSALAGAGVSVVAGLAALPLHAIARQRAIDVGLTTGSWGAWAGDTARSLAIAALFVGIGVACAVGLMRRFRRWWVPASALVVAFGVAITFAGPLVIDPVFNRFTPLAAGPTRTAVLDLARRADVDVGGVYVVDASRRTTAANAYVNGIGSSRRVVLYDTLLRRFTPQQTRLVVAHELGHVHYRDVPHGLLYLLLVAPLGVFAAARLTRVWGPRGGQPAGPRVAAALVAAATLMALLITLVSNQLSRAVEARADGFALRLTGAAPAFVAQQRRIAIQNVDDPDPPALLSFVFGTHPTVVERVGIARTFQRRALP